MVDFRFKILSFKGRSKNLYLFLIGLLFTFGISSVLLYSTSIFEPQAETEEVAAIKAIVKSYHKALETGDRESALVLLSKDVMVLENGNMETAEEYVSHHLAADMEFSAALASKRNVVQATVEGNMGWIISTSTAKGDFRGRQINSAGAELIVLQKENGEWKIRVIHWSSRNIRS